MKRENATPTDGRREVNLAESDRAESADGLPLPPADDAEASRARGEPDEGAGEEDAERRGLDGAVAAERGAD
jgi:hypothetical protein